MADTNSPVLFPDADTIPNYYVSPVEIARRFEEARIKETLEDIERINRFVSLGRAIIAGLAMMW